MVTSVSIMLARGSRALFGIVAFTLSVGCANSELGLRELKGGVEMGLQRGSGWTTLTVKPPYIIGPRTNLKLQDGVFTGNIDGRPVKLYIEQEGIHGQGPYGNVNVEIYDSPDTMTIEGSWNDSRVHFKVTGESFRGTIPVWNDNSSPIRTAQSCQYVLDAVAEDGSRVGSSICNGMPENTRIEVPGEVQDFMTRAELTVVLLALLSSPPTTYQERNFF